MLHAAGQQAQCVRRLRKTGHLQGRDVASGGDTIMTPRGVCGVLRIPPLASLRAQAVGGKMSRGDHWRKIALMESVNER